MKQPKLTPEAKLAAIKAALDHYHQGVIAGCHASDAACRLAGEVERIVGQDRWGYKEKGEEGKG